MKNDDIEVKVQLGILKPLQQVFDAIVDPEKMSKYFISWGSDRMESEKDIDWRWDDVGVQLPVKVKQVIQGEKKDLQRSQFGAASPAISQMGFDDVTLRS